MNINVRKFKDNDAQEVSEIIKVGWRSLISKNYSKTAVENQIKENSPKKLIEKSKKVRYFVAEGKNKILGIGGYDEEKVQTFFVKSEEHEKGIGRALMKKVLTEAKKEGIQFLDCWSTFQAEKFYGFFGFERKKIITIGDNNNLISFILMTKSVLVSSL